MGELIEKYFWVKDDFNYTGTLPIEYEHGTGKIENVIIDDFMIQFSINNPGNSDHLFKVTLIRQDFGTLYKSVDGEITAERFANEKRNFIYGKWTEQGDVYTWWALVN